VAKIGEDISERLDLIPAQLRVLVTRRPKYACRRCAGSVVQAHAPERVVPGGLPTDALIAQVIVAISAITCRFIGKLRSMAKGSN
jgi:transposase